MGGMCHGIVVLTTNSHAGEVEVRLLSGITVEADETAADIYRLEMHEGEPSIGSCTWCPTSI